MLGAVYQRVVCTALAKQSTCCLRCLLEGQVHKHSKSCVCESISSGSSTKFHKGWQLADLWHVFLSRYCNLDALYAVSIVELQGELLHQPFASNSKLKI